MSLCRITFTKLSGFGFALVTLCRVRAHSSRGSWADNLQTGKRQGRYLGFPAIVVQKVVDVGISPAEICLSRGESWPCPKEERAHDKRILKEWYQKALLFDLCSIRLGSQPLEKWPVTSSPQKVDLTSISYLDCNRSFSIPLNLRSNCCFYRFCRVGCRHRQVFAQC